MRLFFKKLHRLWFLFSILSIFILTLPLLYPLAKNPEKNYRKLAQIRRFISLWGAYTSGIFFNVTFEEKIDWSKPHIICPNHTSILDIIAVIFICPQPISFIGKAELLSNPVTRIFFKTIDIVVDRSDRLSAFKAFKKADSFIKAGRSLVIFPEGKIDDEYPPRLHEFKAGSFKLALDNEVSIIPVVIQNAWQVLWDSGDKFGSRPGLINIEVLAPIETHSITADKAGEIQTLVYNKMHQIWANENYQPDKQNNTNRHAI